MRKNDIVNFILNNDNLEILKERVNKFNPFKILKTQDQEIRHSIVPPKVKESVPTVVEIGEEAARPRSI